MIENKSFHATLNILFLISGFIIVLCTSTILIITIYHWRRQLRSVLNLVICNSSISLLVFAITYLIQAPYFIQQIYFDAPEPSPLYCKITACLATFGTGLTFLSCVVQAISRFFITVLNKHEQLRTFRTNWILIITIWVASGIIAAGLCLSPSAYQYEPESRFCTLTTKNFTTSSIAVLLFVVFTVTLLIILYGIIVNHTLQHTHINPHSNSTLRIQRNKKVFHMVMFAVAIHAIGGIPYIICIIMNYTSATPWPLYSIAVLFLSVTCTFHAIFLLFFAEEVRRILYDKIFNKKVNTLHTITSTKRNQIKPYGV